MGVDYETGRKLLEKQKSDRQFFESSGFRFPDVEESTEALREFLFENVDSLLDSNGTAGAKLALDKTLEWLRLGNWIKGDHFASCRALNPTATASACNCPLPHIRHALKHL